MSNGQQTRCCADPTPGLTATNDYFVASNGTNVLTVFDPETFGVVRFLVVEDATLQLAELEFINGMIWANNQVDNVIRAFNEDGKLVT